MLGYNGLEDLPDEFESWVKTLVPEEIGFPPWGKNGGRLDRP